MKINAILIYIILVLSGISMVKACDPILEALIFSQDKVTRLDRHFRHFSTRLNEAGSQWRQGKIIPDSIVTDLRSTWLGIFQLSYLQPPESWTLNLSDWQSRLDDIAILLKEFWQEKDVNSIHGIILKIQNRLVELYQPYDKRDIHSILAYLRHMKHLYLRSMEESPEEVKRLAESMLKMMENLRWQLTEEALKIDQILDEYLKIQETEEQKFWKLRLIHKEGNW